METNATPTVAERVAALRSEARNLQRINYNLIAMRRNPRQFGENERRLDAIWREIDTLEGRKAAR